MSTKALSDHGMRVEAIDSGPILSYHSACLWREDAATLLPGSWLNDNVIVWWEEQMTHEEYSGRPELCMLHPGAVFLCNHETVDECVHAALPRARAARFRAAPADPFAPARPPASPARPPAAPAQALRRLQAAEPARADAALLPAE